MEAVDDIVIRNVGDGGMCVEESLDVGPQGFAMLLFAQAQVVVSARPMFGALEVVDEELLQILP